jgi:hypothetical protein
MSIWAQCPFQPYVERVSRAVSFSNVKEREFSVRGPHAVLMWLVRLAFVFNNMHTVLFGSNYGCEQQLRLMKNQIKSLRNEHSEGSARIISTWINWYWKITEAVGSIQVSVTGSVKGNYWVILQPACSGKLQAFCTNSLGVSATCPHL